MENYSKARTVERPPVCPFSGLPSDTPEVRVKDGSKIRNLLRFALSRMELKPSPLDQEALPTEGEGGGADRPKEAASRRIVFMANGKGVSKAITCAEIVKRRVKGLHQITKLLYSTVEEVWEPIEPAAGLDSLTVSRNLPSIWILLSAEPLDQTQPGYQAPGRYDALWAHSSRWEEGGGAGGQRVGHRKKRGGGGGGAGGGRGKGAPSRQTGRPRQPAKGQS